MLTLSKIWNKLRNKKYRKAFVGAELKRGVPFQIRAMRKKLGWSQEKLALASGLTQGVISRAEDPNYGNLTFNTVLDIASGFDVAFIGRFVPFSELAKWVENLSEESVQVAAFEDEDRAAASVLGRIEPLGIREKAVAQTEEFKCGQYQPQMTGAASELVRSHAAS
ncbi:MAG TPA: helix-turn-helix domain-containing protein [Terriglobia bacterium]|nr:helix-turn-helix domain-containing protein [Terriglobia bacterium]